MAGTIHIDESYMGDIKDLISAASEKAVQEVVAKFQGQAGVQWDDFVEAAMDAAHRALEDTEINGDLAERIAHIVTDNVSVDIAKER